MAVDQGVRGIRRQAGQQNRAGTAPCDMPSVPEVEWLSMWKMRLRDSG
jgi:hypothetical protein